MSVLESRRPQATQALQRAAVIARPGEAELRRVGAPEPGPGQVLVRIEGCGVCGSNLPVWEGRPWFDYPLAPGAPGHEGWGTIAGVASDVDDLAPGQRVALLSQNAFAEYDVADASAVVPLPRALAYRPFPGEALGCGMNVFRRAGVRAGQSVAVLGVGFIGAVVARLAAHAGARVMALSRRPFAREIGAAMGAESTAPLHEPETAVERGRAFTDGELFDVVIEATGHQDPLTLGGELTRVKGRLVVAGYHQDGMRQVNMQLWNWRGIDVINAHERDPAQYVRGMREAVEAVVSGRLDPDPLYTHSFPLDRAGAALAAARERPDGFLKALVLT